MASGELRQQEQLAAPLVLACLKSIVFRFLVDGLWLQDISPGMR
jgi:hypothetical protein